MKPGPLQTEWLRCLESGEFHQTTGVLFLWDEKLGEYRNCCLGVAVCVLEANGVDVEFRDACGCINSLVANGRAASLDDSLWKAMKLRDRFGSSIRGGQRSLAELNDDGWTFAQIAAHLREHFDDYFTGEA